MGGVGMTGALHGGSKPRGVQVPADRTGVVAGQVRQVCACLADLARVEMGLAMLRGDLSSNRRQRAVDGGQSAGLWAGSPAGQPFWTPDLDCRRRGRPGRTVRRGRACRHFLPSARCRGPWCTRLQRSGRGWQRRRVGRDGHARRRPAAAADGRGARELVAPTGQKNGVSTGFPHTAMGAMSAAVYFHEEYAWLDDLLDCSERVVIALSSFPWKNRLPRAAGAPVPTGVGHHARLQCGQPSAMPLPRPRPGGRWAQRNHAPGAPVPPRNPDAGRL
ncbi:hypothetical protein CGZ69_30015 [Streptomyces peucetius subsp. caesius ATCC 27952]|nr:hypothetical protein CGZ69_30015 [Streptomyces peucetius subsp. caesius ATCC 27952]